MGKYYVHILGTRKYISTTDTLDTYLLPSGYDITTTVQLSYCHGMR